MRKLWKPLSKRTRFPKDLKTEGAGCRKSNDMFHFELESLVVVETIEEKSEKEEVKNNNVIGTGKFHVHEDLCNCQILSLTKKDDF